MSGWKRWFRKRPALAMDQSERIERWRALPVSRGDTPFEQVRWCIVDVESSGLDVRRDRLIAIGSVPIEAGRVMIGGAFHRTLRQSEASSTPNILVHRISGTQQLRGDEPADVLLDFVEHIGTAPLVAFHAQFDALMIRRAMQSVLGIQDRWRWLDLAALAPALHPEMSHAHRSLDDWLARYGIVPYQRHDALADAVATAQLLLVMFDRARAKGVSTVADLFALAEHRRWLGGGEG
jgi:DNA polymerase III subunit epsilon